METKRILCIIGSMNLGGAETFLMKLYRALDKSRYQIDFLISHNEKSYYEDEIIELGGVIHKGFMKKRNPIKSYINIKKTVKTNGYQHVLRMSENSISAIDLWAAKRGGANTLIMRSTNTKASTSIIRNTLHKVFKFLPKKIANKKIAPSLESAKHMFGKQKSLILKNGIDLNHFEFNYIKRDKIRTDLNLKERFVIGHIGRFSKQKNHIFILEVFYEILKTKPNAYLLLIGEGNEINTVLDFTKEKNILSKIKIVPKTSKVNEYLMAMDLLIFPSLYEGLPNVVVEAQATGLPCFISNTITEEVIISDLVTILPINESPLIWANQITKNNINEDHIKQRRKYINVVQEKGYDINEQAEIFTNFIFGGEDI